jgi:acetyl-CoA carboxylase biotin carboxyl carrier protein
MSRTADDDIAFIRALADLLRESDLGEIEVEREFGEDDALKVRLSRPAAAPVVTHYAAPAPVAAAPAAPAAPGHAGPDIATEDPTSHPGAITSPMVGTAYLSPEPGAAGYVKVGDKVREGQTLMIIEAMKTMNQIPSPRAGTVTRILVDDKQPVEYGAILMIIE